MILIFVIQWLKSCKLQNFNVAYSHDLLSWQLTKNSSKKFLSSFISFFIDEFLTNTNISNIFHDNFFQNTPKKGYHQAITEGKNLSSNDFQSEDLERGKMLLCPWSRCWSLLMPRSSWLLPLEVIENRRRCEKLWVRPRTNWPSKPSSADKQFTWSPWKQVLIKNSSKPAQPKTKRRAREGETRRDWFSKSTIHFNE